MLLVNNSCSLCVLFFLSFLFVKATPLSSPYRSPAAVKQQEESSADDEKDITSAIRKIEFSVNQNIATRRKHSKVTVEETPQKYSSVTFGEGNKNTADFNQNNITADSKTSEARVNEEHSPCGHNNYNKKMEDEKCRTESASSEEINANDGLVFGAVQQNGEEKLISFEGSDEIEIESSNFSEPLKKEAEEEVMEQGKDDVDGVTVAAALVTETDIKASAFEFEPRQDYEEDATPESESLPGVSSAPVSHEEGQTVQEMAQTDFRDADIEEQQQPPAPQQLSAAENLAESTDFLPGSVDDHVTDNSDDKPTPASKVPVSDVHAADVPVPVLGGSASPDVPAPDPRGSASPDAGKNSPVSPEKKVAESPKKKAAPSAKNTKESQKTKQASAKNTAAKKETTAGRTKTTHAKVSARPPTESTTGKNAKRPTSAAKTTTKTAASTRTTTSAKTSPTSSSASNTAAKKTFPTATTKKPAAKTEVRPASRPVRTVKTTAFGSTVSKPPAKKPSDSARPSTAPPGRSTQAKGKPVAAKVQTGLSSSRPQSARPKAAAAAEGKDATDGGAASKGTGKPTKPPIRKTQTKTVTTLKTAKTGGDGTPEVTSQTVKTTKTVTDANGKKTTKTTLKEVSPTGRKPLRMTKTETTDSRKAPARKNESGKPESKTATKKPDAKSKVGGTTRVGSAGTRKPASGLGAKKTATKNDAKAEQQVSKYLKGTIPKAKTVKELSNPLGITKPIAVPKTTTTTAEAEVKSKVELNVETTAQEEAEEVVSHEVVSGEVVSKETVSDEVESEAESKEELKIETEVQEEAKEVVSKEIVSNEVESEAESKEELKIETEVQEEAKEVVSREVVSSEVVSKEIVSDEVESEAESKEELKIETEVQEEAKEVVSKEVGFNEVETEAESKEELKIKTEVQEEAKEVVSNEADTSTENPGVFQDLVDFEEKLNEEVVPKEDEKIVEEEGEEDVEKEEEVVVNEDERRMEEQGESVPDREEPGVEEDEGFVEKDVGTGERFEDGDRVLEEDDREVPENGEMVKEEEDEQNDEQFDYGTRKDAGIATEYDITTEEPGASYTANTEASEERVVTISHSEKISFPETNEEAETPKQDEAMFEDSIELNQDVPDQVLIETTRSGVTEAWPDEQEEHGSGEETGGEPQDEEEKGVERKNQDSPLSEEPQIDPWDPASHQVDFDVPHSAIVDTGGDGEYTNNNMAEYSGGALLDTESPLNPDLVPACAHPTGEVFSEGTTADQMHEGVSEAGNKNADLFLFGDANQNGEAAQTKFQEFCSFQGDDVSPEEGNERGTVDDLLS